MVLQKRFYVSSNAVAVNRGNIVAPWNGNYNKSNWWYDGNDTTSYFYSSSGDSTYIQYGQNLGTVPWASARFFGETVTITNEVENSDGSVSATVSVTPDFFAIRRTDFAAPTGFDIVYKVSINGTNVFNYTGSTIDEFTLGGQGAVVFPIRVNPEIESNATALKIEITYPNGEYPNSTTTVGIALYNPNPPNYIPNFITDNGIGKGLDNHNGYNQVTRNGTISTLEPELFSSIGSNSGHNKTTLSNVTKQARAYNDNGTIK